MTVKNEKRRNIIILTICILFFLIVSLLFTLYGYKPKSVPEFIYKFSLHFFPDLIVALIVYLLLEGNIKYMTNVTKVSSRPPEKVIDLFNDAKREIRILDTFISDLLSLNDIFFRSIEKALDRNVKIKILLLNPESNAAKQRNNDLMKHGKNIYKEMRKGTARLYYFWQNLPETKKNLLKIKLFNATPSIVLISADADAYLSFFDVDKNSQSQENLLLNLETRLGKYAEDTFFKIWRSNTITSLENYLKLKLKVKERSLAHIDGTPLFYFCGEEENDNSPKYITYKADGAVDNYFERKLGQTLNFSQQEKDKLATLITKLNPNEDKYEQVIQKINSKYIWNKELSQKQLMMTPKIYEIEINRERHQIFCSEDDIPNIISDRGFLFISSNQFTWNLELYNAANVLSKQWDSLDFDEYLKEDGEKLGETWDFRYRKIANFNYDYDIRKLEFIENGEFKQYRDYTKGVERSKRVFTLINQDTKQNLFFRMLIKFDLDNLVEPKELLCSKWKITVHFFRVTAKINHPGLPSPEGIHQDEHDYMAMHLIKRKNVENGVSKIYKTKNENTLLEEFTMDTFMDTLYIWDKQVYHYTSEITTEKDEGGYRDIMVIDYDRIK